MVLLAGDHRVWVPKHLHSLWTLTRIIGVLQEIWHCRSTRAEIACLSSAAVVTRVIRHLQMAIDRDWVRVSAVVPRLSDLPEDHFRGRNPTLSEEAFVSCWTYHDVRCKVRNGT